MYNKYIFLDVDGVLNNSRSFREQRTRFALDGDCILRLKRLVEATSAKIILSSTWRLYPSNRDYLKIRLHEYQLEIFDQVRDEHDDDGDSLSDSRVSQIIEWLERDNCGYRAVVLDDYNVETYCPAVCLIRTTFNDGLIEENVRSAIHFLNEGGQNGI